MRRRSLLKLAALTAGASAISARGVAGGLLAGGGQGSEVGGGASGGANGDGSGGVRRVLIVSKCHLDVGFTDTQAAVMRKYFDVYYPAAMETAAAMRAEGRDGYRWTTGSWLMYEYLEQATAAERSRMEKAIAAGDVTWHALPFSWQTEMLDRSMIEGALGISGTLDARFGRKTIGAKMTDVPGHTRGIIAPMEAAGVRLLHVGVNAASTPPEVPEAFLWRDPAGASLPMLYSRHDYGGVIRIPGSDVAVCIEVRDDNGGPHTPAEIRATFARLRGLYPGAEIRASDLSEVALSVEPHRARLPVVTGEIGDTWIHGVASDPRKVARYREVARLRRAWIGQGRLKAGDAVDRRMLRRLLLEVEHTWGTDTKSYLDNNHYRPADLAAAADLKGYRVMETSWKEKRDDLDEAVAALPPELGGEARARLQAMEVKAPEMAGLRPLRAGEVFEGAHFRLRVDPANGALTQFESKGTGRQWASGEHPLALFTYQTLSAEDFDDFIARYITVKTEWAPKDFGKPNIAAFGARHGEWQPKLKSCGVARGGSSAEDRLVMELAMPEVTGDTVIGDEAKRTTAWPRSMFVEMVLPRAEPVVHLSLVTLGKVANRLPEAMWLTFAPMLGGDGEWILDKADSPVRALDVVRGGNRRMHAVGRGIEYRDAKGMFRITTLDAPVVAMGDRSPINYSPELPTRDGGVHFSLFNNAWGTNYPQWASGDWRFRFTLEG